MKFPPIGVVLLLSYSIVGITSHYFLMVHHTQVMMPGPSQHNTTQHSTTHATQHYTTHAAQNYTTHTNT